MNIVIIGAGEVGKHLAQNLSTQQHNIVLIEESEDLAQALNEELDAHVVCSNGASATTLAEVDIGECDLFLGLTRHDATNLLAASLAKSMGAKKTIARVHAGVQREEWLFDYRSHLKIDYLFSTERLAAVELAKYVRNPHGRLVEEIARGRIELQQIRIPRESPMVGKPICDLALPRRVRIASIYRDKGNIIPGGDDQLESGDLVTFFGEPSKLQEVLRRLSPTAERQKAMKVVIFGGSEYALALAQTLEGPDYQVRIMEQNQRQCHKLSDLLQHSVIINADATSLQQLREEQIGEADFFIAASADDEDNVMTCLQAKSLGTEYCLTLVHRADYANAIYRNRQRLGILAAVSPRLATNRDLLRFVETDKFHKFADLEAETEVIELTVREGSFAVGKKISQVDWPKGSALVGLIRDQSAIVPTGDDSIEKEDTVYAIVIPEVRRALVKLFTHS